MKAGLALMSLLLFVPLSYGQSKYAAADLQELGKWKKACDRKSGAACEQAGLKLVAMTKETRHRARAKTLFSKACKLGEINSCDFQKSAMTADIGSLRAKRNPASPKK